MKNLLVAAKVFAFVNLLFVPSIALVVFVAALSGDIWWVAFIGVPALFTNLVVLLINPFRQLIWWKLDSISGTVSRR